MKDRYSIDKRGLMHDFHYEGGRLFCEGVAVEDIVRETGTPLYLYSLNTLRRHFRVFDEAFAAIPHIVCFAMKANSNSAVVGAFAAMAFAHDPGLLLAFAYSHWLAVTLAISAFAGAASPGCAAAGVTPWSVKVCKRRTNRPRFLIW